MTLSQLEQQLRRMREVHGDCEVRVECGDGEACTFGVHTASWCQVDGEPVVVYLDITAEADTVDVS